MAPPPRDVEPLPYLDDRDAEPWGLDVALEVRLPGHTVSRTPFASMYWTFAQMLAHMTDNGAPAGLLQGRISGVNVQVTRDAEEVEWGNVRGKRELSARIGDRSARPKKEVHDH